MGGKKRRSKQTRLPRCRGRGGGEEPSSAAATAADRLSSLPDELLLSIVRHLPVREVVRMSMLGRQWRCLPSLLPVLDFLDLSSLGPEQGEEEGFDWLKEADRAMSAHWGLIRRCRFSSCWLRVVGDWVVLVQWAEAIARRGIRELELYDEAGVFDGFPVLHYCKSLTKLALIDCYLTGDMAVCPLSVRCTDLRELRLEHVHIWDVLFKDLISTCLRLESLEIWDCIGFGHLRINALPCLRYLMICLRVLEDEVEYVAVDIDTPNLDLLDIRVVPWWCEEFTVRAPKLTSLRIHLIEEEEEEEKGALRGSRVVAEGLGSLMNSSTKLLSLELHGTSIKCLSLDLAPESFHPSFPSLTKLSIDMSLHGNQQASYLAILLQRGSRLRVLELCMIEDGFFINEAPFYFVLLFWEDKKMLEQMDCLSHHLQEVTISGLTGEIYEMKLAGFFLMEACALKKLTLKFRKDYAELTEVTEIIAEHLPNLRRGSSEARNELIYEYSKY